MEALGFDGVGGAVGVLGVFVGAAGVARALHNRWNWPEEDQAKNMEHMELHSGTLSFPERARQSK